jgi:hypothetical protein
MEQGIIEPGKVRRSVISFWHRGVRDTVAQANYVADMSDAANACLRLQFANRKQDGDLRVVRSGCRWQGRPMGNGGFRSVMIGMCLWVCGKAAKNSDARRHIV